MPTLSACNNIRIYSKVEDYEIENETCVDTEYEWEKMVAALTSTYLIAKSRGRQELGLPTSSAAVHSLFLFFLNAAVYDVSIYSNFFMWTANLLNVTTFFCARIDLFTILAL